MGWGVKLLLKNVLQTMCIKKVTKDVCSAFHKAQLKACRTSECKCELEDMSDG